MSKERIVQAARDMLAGKIGIVDGSIAICRARPGLDDSDLQNELLFPFIAFESELHNFPIDEVRKLWNQEALKAQDARVGEIVSAAQPEILEACKTLLESWG